MKNQTIKFYHNGLQYCFTFIPTDGDWWTAFYDCDVVFDVHYCEDYNHICVYVEGEYSDSIFIQPIKN